MDVSPGTGRRQRTHVAVGGAVGALLRTGIVAATLAATRGGEVIAVLLVNLGGAFALGWLVGRARHDPRWVGLLPLLGTGLLGSLTTFSTLADQLARAVAAGQALGAIVLGVVSLGGGLGVAALGSMLGPPRGARDTGGRA